MSSMKSATRRSPRAKLAWWRGEIDALFRGQPSHPVTRALQPFIAGPFGITQERLHAIIDGMEMDLRQNRYLDFAALQRYAHLVAGVVGEMSASIFGYRHPATLEYAGRLGLALQLINIIRDVGDDARRGRLYLPLDELQQFGVKVADVLNARNVGGFVPLMRFQAERARALYREALALLPAEDRKAQRTGLIMGAIYCHPARRDRARRLPGAAPAHRADAAAQAVDRVEDLGLDVTARTARRRHRRRLGRLCGRGGLRSGGSPASSCSKRAASSADARAALALELDGDPHTLDNGQHLLIGAYTAIGQLLAQMRRRAGLRLRRAARSRSPIPTACACAPRACRRRGIWPLRC